MGTFGSFFHVDFVIGFVDDFQTFVDLGDIHVGVLDKLIHDELVFWVGLDLLAGKQIEDGLGLEPAFVQFD